MPEKFDKNILKYNHGQNSIKIPFVIYADKESLLEKNTNMQQRPQKIVRN